MCLGPPRPVIQDPYSSAIFSTPQISQEEISRRNLEKERWAQETAERNLAWEASPQGKVCKFAKGVISHIPTFSKEKDNRLLYNCGKVIGVCLTTAFFWGCRAHGLK